MSFRGRMTLTIAVLTAIALGGAFTAVSSAFNRLQRQQLDRSLLTMAQTEAAEAPRNAFNFSSGPGPATNDVGPLSAFGVIFDERGTTLSATAPFDVSPPDRSILRRALAEPFDLRHPSGPVRGVVVAVPGHEGKRVFLATSRADLDGDETFLFRAMFSAFLVAVAWVGLVAYWMGGRLVRDHHAIASVARAVARGDLTARSGIQSKDPEVAQLSRDIDEMIERLAELVNAQQRFIAHAAHELRSPLAALSGELQQALRKERDAEGYKRAIQSALVAARRLTLLAEDLLTLARLRADSVPAYDTVDVARVIELAIAPVEPLAAAHGVEIVRRAEPARIPDRNGDTSRLVRNLLENAIRFSPRGGCVRVEAVAEDSFARITVTDQGPGVAAAERQHIFTAFFRGAGSIGTHGAGLGLGIAREIARSYGGDVKLEVAAKEGARFVISLPLADDSQLSSARTEGALDRERT
ncbi:MAG: HAMP domain-containing histidine kinase [Alphaproteobacteria bacterium]|nr:HAMP domain-containing histidine kinase [Alphaproteobacteria bacterium]